MGFTADEAALDIARGGQDASISMLVDSIYTAQTAREYGCSGNFSDDENARRYSYNSFGGKKKRKFLEDNKKKKRCYGDHGQQEGRGIFNGDNDESLALPNPMVGFGLPNDRLRLENRRLPAQ